MLGGVLLAGLAWGAAGWFAQSRIAGADEVALATASRAARAGQQLVSPAIDAAAALLADLVRRGAPAQAAFRLGHESLQLAAITDAAGRIVWASEASLLGASLADRPAFARHRAGQAELLLSPALLALPGGPRSLLASRPLSDARGDFAGVALVAIDSRWIDQALGLAALLPGLRLALLGPDGTPLAVAATWQHGATWPRLPTSATASLLPALGDQPPFALAARPVAREILVLTAFDTTSLSGPASEAGRLGYLGALLFSLLVTGLPRLRRRPDRVAGDERLNEALPAVGYHGIIQAGGVLRLTEIGAGIERLTGWTVETALRPGWRQRGIDAASLPLGPDLADRLWREPSAATEYRFRRADGGWMWLRETLRATGRKSAGITVAGALEDISAERELALQATTAAKFATLGEMAAGLAHELNQPIAIMSLAAENATEALEAGEDGVEEALVRLRRIMAQADRAKAIVTQLRAFSRVDVSALEPVDLGSAVQGMMVLAGQALRDAGIQVQLRLPDVLPPVVGQIILIEQVLLNLVLNARDALLECPTELRRLRIEAHAGRQAESRQAEIDGREESEIVMLRVTDTGPGLTVEVQEKLFEPFYTTKPPGFGTGLGLSISRTIMRGLGGRIHAANAPDGKGMGAEFTLVFRRAVLPSMAEVDFAAHAPAPRWPAAT